MDNGMDQTGDERIQGQLRRAAEQLYEDTRLRDALDDSQARQLLSWGMRELQRAATLPVQEEAPSLEERAAGLREVMGRINQFVEGYGRWSEGQRRQQMAALVEWLCRARASKLEIGDLMQLEALAASGTTLSPQELFTSLIAAVMGQEEE
jgi:hypothetical protein